MDPNTAPNFPKMPMSIRNAAAHHPARRDAQPVREMTPLLPAWDTMGGPVPSALTRLPSPSHRMPPWILLLNSVPSISTLLISAVARMSGMHRRPRRQT